MVRGLMLRNCLYGGGNVQDRFKWSVVVASVVSLGTVPLIVAPASADTTPPAYCAGDTATVSWTPPADTSGLTGYYVVDSLTNDGTDGTNVLEVNVPLTETSTTVTLDAGYNDFTVYATTAAGTGGTVGSEEITGGVAPLGETWFEDPSFNTVGDRTATVYFNWTGPVTAGTSGYIGASETVSDGSQTVATSPGSPVTFTGLTDGRAYSYISTTSNACGSSTSGPSPTFVPGTGPQWTSASPPLVAPSGLYSARFSASGDPRPRYQLIGAPSWLHLLNRGPLAGYLHGVAPMGTTSFSYSVTAVNGVGVAPGGELGSLYPSTDITAGPFTITVP
jgi:hypothetical protein